MSRWPTKKLAEVSEVFGGSTPSRENPDFWNGDIAWLSPSELPMPGEGIARIRETRETITQAGLNSCSATLLPRGAVVFSSRATIGKIGVTETPLATNQGFVSFVPSAQLSAEYLAYTLLVHTDAISSLAGSTTFKEVSRGSLRAFEIPVPHLAEQERIVRLLDEAAALRRLRTQADERTEELIASMFTALFGDIESAASKFPKRALGDLCEILSGATPSTENPDFWTGSIPWVSAKDMKRSEIADAIDHVSEAALQASRLKLLPAGAVLVVVRGMILAHTFPVALTTTPLTINQDLKALICRDELVPLYLQQCLCGFAPRILAAASTAGHGTKRLETESLRNLPIPVPPMKVQQVFATRVAEIRALETEQATSRRRLDDLFQSLLHRAFNGDL